LQSTGEYSEAEAAHRSGLQLFNQADEKRGSGNHLICLGEISCRQGDFIRGEALIQQGLELAQALGDQFIILYGFESLGTLAYLTQDYAEAEAYYQACFDQARVISDHRNMGYALIGLGRVSSVTGRFKEAVMHFKTVLAMALETCMQPVALWGLTGLITVTYRTDGPNDVLDLLYFVLNHPATEYEAKIEMKQLWTDLIRHLPAMPIDQAKQRSQNLMLKMISTRILNQFP
jgi:ATP/maltotriose-dependent transcriptional regulator MalT